VVHTAKKKPQGHYCYVCGEHKANEKFSGKGHANHICKACAGLPVAERNAMQAIRRIEGMAMRHISDNEVKWLRNHLNDSRPEVQQAAREVYHMKFHRYERGQIKKGLTVFSLEFYLHGDVWDEDGDEFPVHVRITADQDGAFRLIDYAIEQETQVAVDKSIAKKFMKSLIHEWDILFWDEDLSDSDAEYDPYLDILPEYRDLDDQEEDDEDFPQEPEQAAPQGDPICTVHLMLNKGKSKELVFYNQLHDEPRELYWALLSFFEPDKFDDELIDAEDQAE